MARSIGSSRRPGWSHCIGLNHIAIGIENVGDEDKVPLTDAQVTANAALIRELAARFPITHLLGHHEVMKFRDNAYYLERERGYQNAKGDPGARFMARVREQVADLKLSGLTGYLPFLRTTRCEALLLFGVTRWVSLLKSGLVSVIEVGS